MAELLSNPQVLRLLEMTKDGLLFAVWETMYVTVISTLFAYVIGLPLGVIAVVGEPGGVLPLPRPVMAVMNFVINILRSVPFLILMVLVIPLSRILVSVAALPERHAVWQSLRHTFCGARLPSLSLRGAKRPWLSLWESCHRR